MPKLKNLLPTPLAITFITTSTALLSFLARPIVAACSGVYNDQNPLGVICPPVNVPTEANQLPKIISNVILILIFVAAIAAFIYLVLGGIGYITSGGDSGKAGKARQQIIYAIIGLVVVLLAFAIMTLVGNLLGVDLTSPKLPF